ncbi:sensor histidine kinase [Chryseolinea sp. H1M3-3]|uniref:sensor histidine kinase n=1 Tax=Chryseolinea sp. H1M3-3 TaxID=3034144 RepID=UPI0023EB5A91|nr:sensor histidine kinase [Chryseolinea sp. H1M3-3]
MKISFLIFFSFLFILLLFSITTYINFQQSEEVSENSKWVDQSTTIIRNSNRFQRNILNMISGLRGYLFTSENYFIQAYDSAKAENETILSELTALIPPRTAQATLLGEIRNINDNWLNDFSTPLIEAKKLADDSDSTLISFNKLYREKLTQGTERYLNRQLQEKIRVFINNEYNSRDERTQILDQSVRRTRAISFVLTTLSIIVGSIISIFLAYRISTRIMLMVKMANEIAGGNYEVYTKDSGRDELSNLAHSLNNMAQVLKENITLLKRKNQELDQFAHIVSHDLKAPLRGIDNVVSWIEEDHSAEMSPKLIEYIHIIKGRLLRAENLIHGILSYARIGKETQEKEDVDLNQLVDEIGESLTMKSGIKILVYPKLPKLFTEKVPLEQVFSNLIGNAVKHHDKKNGVIKIYHKEYLQHYEFFVEDNGPGIGKNYHNKIFVIFQTLQERDTLESTGVGLAIVKKILDDRNQKIHITSDAGTGAIFSFTWPK